MIVGERFLNLSSEQQNFSNDIKKLGQKKLVNKSKLSIKNHEHKYFVTFVTKVGTTSKFSPVRLETLNIFSEVIM